MDDRIERLYKNYSNARQSWESWFYMTDTGPIVMPAGRPDYESSNKKKVDENTLLFYLRYLAWKDYHIEIYKIIKDNNNTKDNIFLLLREFSKLRPDLKTEIDTHLARLEELKEPIKKITDLRDKFYAHLDPDYSTYGGHGGLEPYHDIFIAVENAIMAITSREDFKKVLDKIPSRDEFNLDIG